jgi:hypothetical protein
MSIEFTGGFTITQGGITPEIGNYYLVQAYRPANNQGEITIPNHDNTTSSLDFNIVNENSGSAIYINKFDDNGNNNSTYLNDLIGNHTHITFTQNAYHITFDCTNQAWQDGGATGSYANQIFHDSTFGSAPQNSISIVSTSGVVFNDTDVIGITIQVI